MAEFTMVKALNEALRRSLADDPRMLVLGEDIGPLGGVFRVTEGLQAEFGSTRVFDTPLAESAIAGVSLGLALAGWRPVAEMLMHLARLPAKSLESLMLAVIEQPQWDVPLLAELSQVMRDASICGLGQAAPNPIDCVVRYFPQELA